MRLAFQMPILFCCLLILLSVIGCQKNEDSTPTFTKIYSETLATACIECHRPGGSAAANGVTLDFSTQALAYSTLLSSSVNGILTASHCPGVKIVVAGSPATSYLIGTNIQGYSSTSFAGVSGCQPYSTHYSTLNLSADQANHLVSWVQAGALNN